MQAVSYPCSRHSWRPVLVDGALINMLELLGTRRAVHKEANGLALRNVVEGDQADVALREAVLALTCLLQHLLRVVAAKHGQLPHRPVPVVVVALHSSQHHITASPIATSVSCAHVQWQCGPKLAAQHAAKRDLMSRSHHVSNMAGLPTTERVPPPPHCAVASSNQHPYACMSICWLLQACWTHRVG